MPLRSFIGCGCGYSEDDLSLFHKEHGLPRHKFYTGAGLIVFFVSFASPLWVRADDEFKALPGLWKTSLLTSNSATHAAPKINWHCVDEGSHPRVNFPNISMPRDKSCKSQSANRTSTSLKWRIDCAGSSTITNEGAIVFSSADHYRGKVELHGTLMGYPLDQTILVEGKRYAACTSPQD